MGISGTAGLAERILNTWNNNNNKKNREKPFGYRPFFTWLYIRHLGVPSQSCRSWTFLFIRKKKLSIVPIYMPSSCWPVEWKHPIAIRKVFELGFCTLCSHPIRTFASHHCVNLILSPIFCILLGSKGSCFLSSYAFFYKFQSAFSVTDLSGSLFSSLSSSFKPYIVQNGA